MATQQAERKKHDIEMTFVVPSEIRDGKQVYPRNAEGKIRHFRMQANHNADKPGTYKGFVELPGKDKEGKPLRVGAGFYPVHNADGSLRQKKDGGAYDPKAPMVIAFQRQDGNGNKASFRIRVFPKPEHHFGSAEFFLVKGKDGEGKDIEIRVNPRVPVFEHGKRTGEMQVSLGVNVWAGHQLLGITPDRAEPRAEIIAEAKPGEAPAEAEGPALF